HRALDEGPPFVAVLFIELQTGREWVGFAVAKDFAIWADAHDARAAGTDGHAAGGLAEFGVAVRRETYGDAFGIEVAIGDVAGGESIAGRVVGDAAGHGHGGDAIAIKRAAQARVFAGGIDAVANTRAWAARLI